MLRLELKLGSTPHESAEYLVEKAKELKMPVEGRHSGIVMSASSESTVAEVELQWYKKVYETRTTPREI